MKRLVPRAIRERIRKRLKERQLRFALNRFIELSPDAAPSRELLLKLESGWSNEGMSARLEYLQAVIRYANEVQGAILECGSGLTTLVLAAIAQRRGLDVWTLEDSAVWHKRVSETLHRYKLKSLNNCLVQLKDYGDFAWYEPPLELLPHTFDLIVCDGPLGTTKAGRYGLLPLLKSHFKTGTTILLDDADRPAEEEAIHQWSKLIPLQVSLHEQSHGQFAVITIQDTAQQS